MKVRKFLFGHAEIRGTWGNLGLALLRVFAGFTLAFLHGMGKLPPSDRFIQGVGQLGFPMPVFFAWASAMAEFLGGLLLGLGLLTRPAALFIAINMTVAWALRHAQDPLLVKEKALLYFFIALAFILIGGGAWSLDHRLRVKKN